MKEREDRDVGNREVEPMKVREHRKEESDVAGVGEPGRWKGDCTTKWTRPKRGR